MCPNLGNSVSDHMNFSVIQGTYMISRDRSRLTKFSRIKSGDYLPGHGNYQAISIMKNITDILGKMSVGIL